MAPRLPIPKKLLTRLTAIKPDLLSNGSVMARQERYRQRAWRLRVRVSQAGRPPRQLAIALRTAKIADAIRTLIQNWRAEAADKQAKNKQIEREAEQWAYFQFGQSRRKRRYVRRQYAKARAGGLMAEWLLEFGEIYRPPVRRAGRPRQSGMAGLATLFITTETPKGDSVNNRFGAQKCPFLTRVIR